MKYLIILFSLIFLWSPANAEVIYPASFEEVNRVTDVVLYGAVIDKRSLFREYLSQSRDGSGEVFQIKRSDERIFTRYTIKLTGVIRGGGVDDEIYLWRLGGAVDGQFLRVGHSFQLDEGDSAIFALQYDHINDSYYAPYGAQGVFLEIKSGPNAGKFVSLLERTQGSSDSVEKKSEQIVVASDVEVGNLVRPRRGALYTRDQLEEVLNEK